MAIINQNGLSATAHEIQAKWDMMAKQVQAASKEIEDELAKTLQKEIDREIVWKLIVEGNPGWTFVTLHDRKGMKWQAIADWMIEHFGYPRSKFELPIDIRDTNTRHCDGNKNGVYYTNASFDRMDLLFQNEKDAIMTILRWK
jgi:hypothetical protein